MRSTSIASTVAPLKRVVVVDDNEMLLKAWSRLLEREDCNYCTTASPEEALRFIEEEGADILISDIVMPRMDGFALAQLAQEKNPELRIVLTTGYVCDFSNMTLEVSSPDVHVLLKPYNDINQIQDFIKRLIRGDESLDHQSAIRNRNDVKIHLWNL